MSLPVWPHAEPPFHAGEQSVQRRAGSFERMSEIGRRVVRAQMPDQHRDFFENQPFLALGAVDAEGQPWATLLAGAGPGFAHSPDDRHLRIDARLPESDPAATLLEAGAEIGLLGIEFQTRRRNRVNGRIVAADRRGFMLEVSQSFGNCPKYIQRREALPRAVDDEPGTARRTATLDTAGQDLVRSADTFFIATHAPGRTASGGTDVSHRGGRPGFVRVEEGGRVLTWPDFTGNAFFNTLGNLAAEPRAGLVFADFERGDLLHVAGRAEIVWEGTALAGFAGAERLVRLTVDAAIHRPAALPLRWRLVESSPFLEATGRW